MAWSLLFFCTSLTRADPPEVERARMVERQLVSRDITDRAVLEAMGRVERHRFVPRRLRGEAYDDHPLPIGHGQTISQPYIVALMSQLADLKPGERVLEVGTGSGYQAAVLAAMGVEVYSVEIVKPVAERAARTLAEVGVQGLHLKIGDGYEGWPDASPFDAILLTAAPEAIPAPLLQQLALGGRLVAPVGDDREQHLVRITRTAKGLQREEIAPVRFVPMTGRAQAPAR